MGGTGNAGKGLSCEFDALDKMLLHGKIHAALFNGSSGLFHGWCYELHHAQGERIRHP